MKRVLVFGASGFIGSSFCRYYRGQGFDVLTVGRSEDSDVKWECKDGVEKLKERVPQRIDRIIHCAAVNEVEINNSIINTFEINVTLTRVLCNFSVEKLISEFIYLSTFHVYGVESGLVGPNSDCNPRNDYGLTHLLSEIVIRNSLRGSCTRSLCLRATNVYGIPGDMEIFNRWTLVPFAFVKSAVLENRIELQTAGNQLRNFVDVRNVVASEFSLNDYEVRDIYGEDTLSIREFANLVGSIVGKKLCKNVAVVAVESSGTNDGRSKLEFSCVKNNNVGSLDKFISELAGLCLMKKRKK